MVTNLFVQDKITLSSNAITKRAKLYCLGYHYTTSFRKLSNMTGLEASILSLATRDYSEYSTARDWDIRLTSLHYVGTYRNICTYVHIQRDSPFSLL
jgi:hypothetical protein